MRTKNHAKCYILREWISQHKHENKVQLEVDIGDTGELFEILCKIPFEPTQLNDSEPSTERHPAVESLISQLYTLLGYDLDGDQ